jgi:anthranilate phosphoribosyltransferase
LGPLCNPARVRRQLLGVFAERWTEPLARVLAELGAERAWVVHGGDGMDELTITGPSLVVEFVEGKFAKFEIEPEQLGLQRAPLETVRGGDAQSNAQALERLLQGKGEAPYRDIVILNAAAALVVSASAAEIRDGVSRAQRALRDGTALAKLEHLRAVTQRLAP